MSSCYILAIVMDANKAWLIVVVVTLYHAESLRVMVEAENCAIITLGRFQNKKYGILKM